MLFRRPKAGKGSWVRTINPSVSAAPTDLACGSGSALAIPQSASLTAPFTQGSLTTERCCAALYTREARWADDIRPYGYAGSIAENRRGAYHAPGTFTQGRLCAVMECATHLKLFARPAGCTRVAGTGDLFLWKIHALVTAFAAPS